jgi:hypothetical protein
VIAPESVCCRLRGYSLSIYCTTFIRNGNAKLLLFKIFCRTIWIMKRGRGRPRKPRDEQKSERIEVRADAAEKRQLEKAAEKADMKLSDWIRDRLNAAANSELSGSR